MEELDPHFKKFCKDLLVNLINVCKGHSSVKFFRKYITTTQVHFKSFNEFN